MNYLTYEQWDAIADSYIPIMALLCALYLIYSFVINTKKLKKNINLQYKHTALQCAAISISVIFVYAIMLLDNHYKFWPSIDAGNQQLDYSTHTALALVFSCFLFCGTVIKQKYLALITLGSMVLYLLLMKYQNYHTFADMLTTIMVVLPPIYWLMESTIKRTTP